MEHVKFLICKQEIMERKRHHARTTSIILQELQQHLCQFFLQKRSVLIHEHLRYYFRCGVETEWAEKNGRKKNSRRSDLNTAQLCRNHPSIAIHIAYRIVVVLPLSSTSQSHQTVVRKRRMEQNRLLCIRTCLNMRPNKSF